MLEYEKNRVGFMGLLDFLFGKPKTQDASRLPALHTGSSGVPVRALTPDASVLDLRVGDVVSYDGIDFVVRNRHVYSSHGFNWFSFHFVDTVSGQKLWVDAEDDDELDVAVSRSVRLNLTLPLPEQIEHQGRTYYLDEHGHAEVLIESQDSTPQRSRVEYWDYCDDTEDYYLSVERWGEELEVSVAQAIEPYELTILGGAHA